MEATNTIKSVASALFELSSAEGIAEQAINELENFKPSIDFSQKNLDLLMQNRRLPGNGSLSNAVIAIVKVLNDHNLLSALPEFSQHYRKLIKSKHKKSVLEIVLKDDIPITEKRKIEDQVYNSEYTQSVVYSIDKSATEIRLNYGWQDIKQGVTDLAGSYARGFIDLAKGFDALDVSVIELNEFLRFYEGNFEYQRFLNDKNILPDAKYETTINILASSPLSSISMAFIWLVLANKRQNLLPKLVRRAEAAISEKEDKLIAEIISANPFNDNEKGKITKAIAKTTGKDIIASFFTDKDIIGGLKIKIGYTIYDGSVAMQLEKIAKDLSKREVEVA